MRLKVAVIALALLGLAVIAQAATVSLTWTAPASGAVPTGYRILYGSTSGQYTTTVDAGAVTSLALTLAPGAYYFVAVSYNVAGTSAPSNEVSTLLTGGDPLCTAPLGTRAIAIFPTGKMTKTGSGGAGSKAALTFQAASPNSPIIAMTIRANGLDVPDSITQGTDLHAIGSLWFTIPSVRGAYTFSIFARNAYGCERDQPTSGKVTIP